jgi:tetratricopeptide (TPR) repeat protein
MATRNVQCSVCGGSGKYAYNDVSPCYGCNGHGFIIEEYDDSLPSSYTPSSSGRSSGPDAEAKMNNEADGYYMAKNYDKAIPLYDKIIDSNSRFKFWAYFHRGKCYLMKGDSIRFEIDLKRAADLGNKHAVEELAKIGIQYTPNSGGSSSSTPLQEGDQFFNEGNYAKAIVKYSQTISKGENKSLALMKRAACYVKKGDKDQAIDDYTAAINSGVLTGSDLATAKAELAKLK